MPSGKANAGRPFQTDDPMPVESGHYEFYTFSEGTHEKKGTSGAISGLSKLTAFFPICSRKSVPKLHLIILLVVQLT